MKIIILIVLAGIMITSCNRLNSKATNQDIAKDSIRAYVQSNFNDPTSYEPVKFGRLDSTETIYMDSPEYKAMEAKLDSIKALKDNVEIKYISAIGEPSELALAKEKLRLINKEGDILKQEEDLSKTYKGKFDGFFMKHSYRAKNAMGAKILQTSLFRFDPHFKILEVTESK